MNGVGAIGNKWLTSVIVGLFGLGIWFVLSDSLLCIWIWEFKSILEMSYQIELIILVIAMVGANLLWEFFQRFTYAYLLIMGISVLSLVAHYYYIFRLSPFGPTPDIFEITPSWSIQGTIITISGYDLGQSTEPGSVYVGDIPYTVNYWSPTKIVITQPVTGDFGDHIMRVCTYDNECIDGGMFTIKDPSSV